MNKIFLKKSEIIAKKILLSFIDVNRFALEFFDSRKLYRKAFEKYDELRNESDIYFQKEISRLIEEGVIKKYYRGRKPYLELSQKGKKRLKKYLTKHLEIKFPRKWDKKWRIVIFDVPDKKKKSRDVLRRKLLSIGFLELQESVYVFPFDCWPEIDFLKRLLNLENYIQYIVAERIETETDLLKNFVNNNTINEKIMN